jgi:FlaA1/EpsC-like NDP-sugar epimerase
LALETIFRAQPSTPTIFTLVRYGNVVASNGSVIPLWRQQASEGCPLTITDPEMTRFWMAPSTAVSLIVQCGKQDGSVLVLVPQIWAHSRSRGDGRHRCTGRRSSTIGLRRTEKRHEDLIHEDELVVPAGDLRGLVRRQEQLRAIATPRILRRVSVARRSWRC